MRLRGYPPDGTPAVSYVGSPTGALYDTGEAKSTISFPEIISQTYTVT